ncbi:MAG TPA: hypothetical protein VOB72_23985, partial [Candidatus Dormibacteraeota bacterium]|nr:hypothetical protein [Candidatus Dormibacteraeota bacterium]
MAGPVDLSDAHGALDRLRRQLCHCGLQGECLGCRGIDMVRAQMEAVAAAASQPVLMQVAQEAAMKDMAARFEGMAERLMNDPELRQAAEAMQDRVMSDPETRRLVEVAAATPGSRPPMSLPTPASPIPGARRHPTWPL